MKAKATLAKAIATFSESVAKVSCGAASTLGFYQPKEPKFPKNKK